jgi:hypothetical protein
LPAAWQEHIRSDEEQVDHVVGYHLAVPKPMGSRAFNRGCYLGVVYTEFGGNMPDQDAVVER